jgi:hypothetical protein
MFLLRGYIDFSGEKEKAVAADIDILGSFFSPNEIEDRFPPSLFKGLIIDSLYSMDDVIDFV